MTRDDRVTAWPKWRPLYRAHAQAMRRATSCSPAARRLQARGRPGAGAPERPRAHRHRRRIRRLYIELRDGNVSGCFKPRTPTAPRRGGGAAGGRPFDVQRRAADRPARRADRSAGLDARAPDLCRGADGSVSNTGAAAAGPYDMPRRHAWPPRCKVKSHDGAMVPLSIIHRKEIQLDGSNPAILYGYASYGITEEPFFSVSRLAWLDAGGVFAVANPRGSSVYGAGVVRGRLPGHEAQHLEGLHRLRRVPGRAEVHPAGASSASGRQRGRHPRRPRDDRAARPVRRGDPGGGRARHGAHGDHAQRRAEHPRVRQRSRPKPASARCTR